jgi:hypothetical protein
MDRLDPVSPADVEVSKPAQVAQRRVTTHVDRVGADPPVGLANRRVGLRFGTRIMGDTRRAPIDPAARSHLVALANDVVQDPSEFAEHHRGPFRQEDLQRAMPTLYSSADLEMVGGECL